MEKETVKAFDFEAAFKALDDIEMPAIIRTGSRVNANRINLHERLRAKPGHDALVEDYFNVNDVDELEAAKDEREAEIAKAKLAKIEKIVDLEAETEEDILPSYVGKMIMQCPQCMTLFYKNEEDIEQSEENPEVVNLNEPCQHCGNISGYNLVGKVGSVSEDEIDNFDADDIEIAEDELDLDFPEETEEIDAEGTGDGADEMSDEEDLELDLAAEEEVEEEPVEESLHRSKALDDAEKHSELATEQESEFKTLNESVLDDELDTKLDEHNDYIEYLKDAIAAEERALAAAKNEEIVAAINRKIEALKTDLENALPDAVKAAVDVATDIVEDEVSEVAVEDAAEEEEETNESLHKSKLLAKIEDQNDLKTDIESDYLTLNEELEGLNKGADIKDPRVRKILARLKKIADVTGTKIGVDNMSSQTELIKKHCSEKECNMLRNVELTDGSVVNMLEEDLADWYRKKFDKPASIDTQQKWEETIFDLEQELAKETDPKKKAKIKQRIKQFQDKFAQQRDWETRHELNEDVSEAETEELLDTLWSQEQPTEAEIQAILNGPRFEENIESAEDFDEGSFDKHLTEYFTNVYSNVEAFNSTGCTMSGKQLVVEGCIKFKSGKTKATKFIFESTDRGLVGKNTDFSMTESFRLSTKLANKVLITEGIKYRYSIGESLVHGNTKKK